MRGGNLRFAFCPFIKKGVILDKVYPVAAEQTNLVFILIVPWPVRQGAVAL